MLETVTPDQRGEEQCFWGSRETPPQEGSWQPQAKSWGKSVLFDVHLLLLLQRLHMAWWDWGRTGSSEQLWRYLRGKKMAKIDWKPWWSKENTFTPKKGEWEIPTCWWLLRLPVGCVFRRTICNSHAGSVPPALPKHMWETTAWERLQCHLEGSSAICPSSRQTPNLARRNVFILCFS